MSDELSMEEGQPAKVLLTPAIERSLSAAKGKSADADEGARDLALLYAQLIDDPKAADKYTKALRLVGEAVSAQADDMPITAAEQLMSAWDRISSALAEQTVASDLGPKLLAALTALGMTPAGRAAKVASGKPGGEQSGDGGEVTPMPSALSLLRGGAAQRRAGG